MGYTPDLASSVWVGYPNANIAMPSGQGGTLAAPVFGAYMRNAHGGKCNGFPQPKEPANFSPFFSHSSQTGTSGSTGSTTRAPRRPARRPRATEPRRHPAGGGNRGYDPRLYEAPPQQAPRTQTPPPAAPAPTPGGGGGGGGKAVAVAKAAAVATPAATTDAVAERGLIAAIQGFLGAPASACWWAPATTPRWCGRGRWP